MKIRRFFQVALGASGLGLAATTWFYLASRLEASPTPFGQVAVFFMPLCYIWAAFLPAVLWMAKRYPIRRGHLLPSLLKHIGFAIPLAFANSALRILLIPQFRASLGVSEAGGGPLGALLGFAAYEAPLHFLVYSAILGVTFAVDYARRLREREVATARLSAQLAHAQLQALRAQLNPHFLFNALNGVATLIRDGDQTRAIRLLVKLSDLLRYVLDEGGDQEVPLKTELSFIRRYLQIEQIRFEDRFTITLNIDPDVEGALVPSLLLQPVVENAVRHGIARRSGATGLTISARHAQGDLELRVVDDGPGFDEKAWEEAGRGMGIKNTRSRLAQMYGEEQSLTMERLSPHGAVVTIRVPFRVGHSPEEEKRQ